MPEYQGTFVALDAIEFVGPVGRSTPGQDTGEFEIGLRSGESKTVKFQSFEKARAERAKLLDLLERREAG